MSEPVAPPPSRALAPRTGSEIALGTLACSAALWIGVTLAAHGYFFVACGDRPGADVLAVVLPFGLLADQALLLPGALAVAGALAYATRPVATARRAGRAFLVLLVALVALEVAGMGLAAVTHAEERCASGGFYL